MFNRYEWTSNGHERIEKNYPLGIGSSYLLKCGKSLTKWKSSLIKKKIAGVQYQ